MQRIVLVLCCVLGGAPVLAQQADVRSSTDQDIEIGADSARLLFSLREAASRTTEGKADFVAALGRFVGGLWDARGASDHIRTAVDSMATALARWDAAIDAYRGILKPVATSAEAHVALGTALVDRGMLAEAADEFRRAVDLAPRRGEAWLLLGLTSELQGKHAESARSLDEAARAAPESAAIAYARVQQAIVIGDERLVSRTLLEFRDRQDRIARVKSSAASAAPFVRFGLFRESAGIAPVFVPALYAEGVRMLDARRYAEAVASFRRAIDRDPLTATTAASIGQLQSAIQRNSSDERARLALAEALIASGDLQSAERVLVSATEAIPESGRAYYRLARLYQSQSRVPDALTALTASAQRSVVVGRDSLYETIAALRVSEGEFDGAIAASRLELQVNPNNAPAHRRLGDLYAQDGRLQESLGEYAAARLIDPRDADVHASRAQALLRLSRFADAEAAARIAVEISPTHEAARYALGTALMRLGRADEGLSALQEFERLHAETRARNDAAWQLKVLKEQALERAARQDYHAAADLLRRAVAYAPPDGSVQLAAGAMFAKAHEYDQALPLLTDALTHNALEAHRYLAEVYAAIGRDEESRAHRAAYDAANARAKGSAGGK